MKLIPTLFLIVAAGSLGARADLPADWSTNYNETFASAASAQKPVLVYFTASWCGPCKMMTRATLADPSVVQALANIEHVAVDIDEHPDLASQHGVQAVPTLVMVSAVGSETDRSTGFLPVDEFLRWLTNGLSVAQAATERQMLAKKELGEVDQLLDAMDSNSNRVAATNLFDLCSTRDPAVLPTATLYLKTLSMRDPALVLEGLNDPRLATRIQVANALHGSLGDSFDVDPWSPSTNRQQSILKWRAKLATQSKQTAP